MKIVTEADTKLKQGKRKFTFFGLWAFIETGKPDAQWYHLNI